MEMTLKPSKNSRQHQVQCCWGQDRKHVQYTLRRRQEQTKNDTYPVSLKLPLQGLQNRREKQNVHEWSLVK